MSKITLQSISLPDFGTAGEIPEIPVGEFEKRKAAAIAAMNKKGLDFLVVFADREHFANFCFLTNLDPRFEDAMLLLNKNGKGKVLFGNECTNWGGRSPIAFDYELYQEFSLIGQDRSKSRPLEEICAAFGIAKGSQVGTAFNKYFYDSKGNIQPEKLDIPTYAADILRYLTGGTDTVVNANDIFMHPSTGLRNHLCLEELVRFEWASVRTSNSIKNMVRAIKPGMREYELSAHYVNDGLPYSCHPMLSTGAKASTGLSSPSANKVKANDPFTAAFGLWGALTCRAGMVAKGPEELDKTLAEFYDKFCLNYFRCITAWYENIGIGVSGGVVMDKVEQARDKSLFDFALNAGHTIHLDEWVSSPFYTGSNIPLHSGVALQMDIIPLAKMNGVAANAEDGVALADETLRKEWASRFPESWNRIQQRRDFMINTLGIQLKPEVLPFSNIPAYYSPYLLSNNLVAVIENK